MCHDINLQETIKYIWKMKKDHIEENIIFIFEANDVAKKICL
jgi:hypothetical protein